MQKGGTVSTVNSSICECPCGLFGPLCEYTITRFYNNYRNWCESEYRITCYNGGICFIHSGMCEPKCRCTIGFTGKTCNAMFTTTLATWIDLHERRIEEASLNVTVLIICLIAFLFVSIFMVFCASKTIRNKYKSMLKPCCYKDGISNTSSNAHRNIESVPVSMTIVYPQRTNTPPTNM